MPTPVMAIAPEVRHALENRRPVLALESISLTHGLTRPTALRLILEGEAALRDLGVVPAVVGVVDGMPTVGLSTSQLKTLADREDAAKLSLRDLPIAAAKKLSGGATVAAATYLAHLAGIRVLATSGLGGVQRGAERSWDESADLETLARLPMVIVSSGFQSNHDVHLTLERTETLNLAVVGFRTTDYPGLFIADSGYDIEYSVDSPAEVAEMAATRDGLGITSAILVANPIPEESQLEPARLQSVLDRAWAAADDAEVHGSDTTPFLLDFIERETGEEAVEATEAAFLGNVALAGEIAKAIANR